jgi:hypothetical protein
LGDTIWFEFNIPDTMKDYYTGNFYSVPTENLYTLFTIEILSGDSTVHKNKGIAYTYKSVSLLGEVLDATTTFMGIKFIEENGNRKAHIGLIPTIKGVHHISTLIRSPQYNPTVPTLKYDKGFDANGLPVIELVNSLHLRFNEEGHGYDLYKQNSQDILGSITHPDMIFPLKYGAYTFVVR